MSLPLNLTADQWALQRTTRNLLTQEYPDDPVRQALALTAALAAARQLVGWLRKIGERAAKA